MWNRPLENALKDAIDKRDVARIKALAKMIDDESKRTDKQTNKEGLLSLNADGQSFLLYALARRNIDAFRTLYPYYRHNSTLLQLRDKKGRSLFWYAVALNEETIAKELFACNFNKPKKARETWLQCDNERVSPLHLAARNSNETLLNWLLFNLKEDDDRVSLVNACNMELDTPLHIACRLKRRLNIESLLKSGATVDLPNIKGETFHIYLEKDPDLFPNKDELNKILEKKPRAPLIELDSPYRRMRQDDARLSGVIAELDKFNNDLNSLPAPLANRVNTAINLNVAGSALSVLAGTLTFSIFIATMICSLAESAPLLTLLTVTVPGVGIALLITAAALFVGLCLYGAFTYINNSVQKDLLLQATPVISGINNLTQELAKIDKDNPDVLQVDAATIHSLEEKSEEIRKKFEGTNLNFCNDIKENKIFRNLNEVNDLIKGVQADLNSQYKPLTPARIAASVDDPNNDTIIDLTISPAPMFGRLPPPTSSPRLFAQPVSDCDEEELLLLDKDLEENPPSPSL